MPVVVALQSELFTPLMDTLTPLAVVGPDLLLLPPLELKLQAYPPTYEEIEPPYTCAKTVRQSASYAQRQYDSLGTDPKALTLEPNEPNFEPYGFSASGTRVRSGTLKTSGHCGNVRLTAEELTNLELLIDTTRPLTFVVPQYDCEQGRLTNPRHPADELQVYAPM